MPKIVYEPPKLIAMGGPPAVGKSHLAHHLMQRVAGALLRRGYPILDLFYPVDRESEEYRRFASRTFESLYRLAEINLATGNTVVLDTPFNDIRWGGRDENLNRLVSTYNPDFRLFICTAPDEIIMERMSTREGGKPRPSDVSKLADWKGYAARMHRTGDVKYPFVTIDTTLPAEVNVEKMLELLAG